MAQPTDLIPSIQDELQRRLRVIARVASSCARLLRDEVPCERLLDEIARLCKLGSETEAKLLAYHLQTCLLPQIAALREICAAARSLAERRYGALVAVQRADPLTRFAQPGILLDARLSTFLLQSVFYPGNPLHDGGVLVAGERVMAAGCLFPLCKAVESSTEPLGLRHRAALGLSQVCDALVIVVSEETGRISLARGGRLYRIPDHASLEERILELTATVEGTPDYG